MPLILGIETSCDETAAAVYNTERRQILSSELFSQVKLHEVYGGVVPEIASRSHVEKIDLIVDAALKNASIGLDEIETIAVTTKPGLASALLVGLGFAKSVAWATKKNLVGIDHNDGHIFSSFLDADGNFLSEASFFPLLCLSASGGHTSLHLVKDFYQHELIGHTLDDAAGEAFDKIGKIMDIGYPGGPLIEKLAREVDFVDTRNYPRSKKLAKSLDFSFSGLKTAVLYDLVNRGVYDLKTESSTEKLSPEIVKETASSLLNCVSDVFISKIKLALEIHPEIKTVSFVGGVACNKFIRGKISGFLENQRKGVHLLVPPPKFCTDNGAMIALAAAHKKSYDDFYLDIF